MNALIARLKLWQKFALVCAACMLLAVDLPRPRKRVELAEDPQYVHYRKAVIDFLYTRQAHVEKAACPLHVTRQKP